MSNNYWKGNSAPGWDKGNYQGQKSNDYELDNLINKSDSFDDLFTAKHNLHQEKRTNKPEMEDYLLNDYEEESSSNRVDDKKETPQHNQGEWKESPPSFTPPPSEEKKRGFCKYFEVKHYSKYFDVTTREVVSRVAKSCFPIIPGSIYEDDCRRPDMYGALWVMISLFICIPIFGNLNGYMYAWMNNDLEHYKSSITRMWKIMTLLFIYFFIVPLILHNVFKFGSGLGSGDSRYFFIASVYGYCFCPFIPGLIVYAFPNKIVGYVALIVPSVSSMVFLTKELFNLARSSLGEAKFKLVAGIMAGLHLGFILLLKIWFL